MERCAAGAVGSCLTTCSFRANDKRLASVNPASPATTDSIDGDIPARVSIAGKAETEWDRRVQVGVTGEDGRYDDSAGAVAATGL